MGLLKGKNAHYKNNTCHVECEEPIKLVLGESGNNYTLHHESNSHYYDSWDDT